MVSEAREIAVLGDFPSWILEKSSAKSTKIRTGKIDTLVKSGCLMMGARNKVNKTPPTAIHKISAILGKYWSLSLNFLKRSLAPVETRTITIKRPMPTTGPIAEKTIAKEAGKKIPKPLKPTMCLAAAIIETTKGRRRRRTIVFGGTPALTELRMAYLTGLNGRTGPSS